MCVCMIFMTVWGEGKTMEGRRFRRSVLQGHVHDAVKEQ